MGIILVKDGVGETTNILKVALRRTQEGKRKRIRPKSTCMRTTVVELQALNLNQVQAARLPRSPQRWGVVFMPCAWTYDNDDEHLELTNENKKKNLKLTSGTSAEYCKEELNSGSRSLTSVSRISNKTLLLWRPSETCTCKGCRGTVNAETKSHTYFIHT